MPQKTFVCNECKMIYLSERLAKECEAFCKKHHACNTEIIRNAIGRLETK